MDITDDIYERLSETERRAGEVVQHLEQLDSLQQSLADAGRGLDEVNANVSNLAAATRTTVESLNETLVAFREAVEVIRRSDPAAVRETLARIEAEIGRINAKLGVLDELAPELQSTRKTIADTAKNSNQETKKLVEDAVGRLSRQTIIDRVFGRHRPT
jgi:prefoldin subunit 5